MSRRLAVCAFALSALPFCAADLTGAAEPIPPGTAQPAAAGLTPAQLAILQYNYVTYPQQLQAVQNDAAFAERRVAYLQNRVASYRPMRSFGQYAATYSADQFAQLQLLAAQQDASCINQQEINLWRERQAIVAALLMQSQQ